MAVQKSAQNLQCSTGFLFLILVYYMKSTTEEGGRLTDSVSSQTKSNQVGLTLRPTCLDLVRLEMKLHEVHIAVKFSEAEATLDSADLRLDLGRLGWT